MSKLFYTAQDVSEILNIPKRTVTKFARDKKIKSHILQNRYIFTKDEILRYAKNNLPAECFRKIENKLEESESD